MTGKKRESPTTKQKEMLFSDKKDYILMDNKSPGLKKMNTNNI